MSVEKKASLAESTRQNFFRRFADARMTPRNLLSAMMEGLHPSTGVIAHSSNPKQSNMTASSRIIDPQVLTAAALAWSVLNRPDSKPKNYDGEADYFDDAIPEIHVSPSIAKKQLYTPEKTNVPDLIATPDSSPELSPRPKVHISPKTVVPVLIPSSASISSNEAPLSSRPTKARVSAATMRNIKSRRRVKSAIKDYNKQKETKKEQPVAPATVATVATAPSVTSKSTPSPRKTTSPTKITVPVHIHQSSESQGVEISTSPPSAIECALIRFKVKNSTSNAVIRFQCEPIYGTVRRNIEKRMRIEKFRITFQDVDGDTCVLSDDENVNDAIKAANNDMVRLTVEEEKMSFLGTLEQESKNLFQSFSSMSLW